jgi:hypothetical protein
MLEVTALMMSAAQERILFQVPGDLPWSLVFDTAHPDAKPGLSVENNYPVEDRAAVLLVAEIPT